MDDIIQIILIIIVIVSTIVKALSPKKGASKKSSSTEDIIYDFFDDESPEPANNKPIETGELEFNNPEHEFNDESTEIIKETITPKPDLHIEEKETNLNVDKDYDEEYFEVDLQQAVIYSEIINKKY